METSQLICSANRLTGYYMMGTLVFNELIILLRKYFSSDHFGCVNQRIHFLQENPSLQILNKTRVAKSNALLGISSFL